MMRQRHGDKTLKLQTSVAQKLTITEVDDLDPIAVYLEDFGPGWGKVTITCFDDSWSRCWSHMGETHNIRSFMLKADKHYLAGKFAPQVEHTVDDPDKLVDEAKKHIIERRRGQWSDLDKEKARELYDQADDLYELWHEFNGQGGEMYRDLMFEIFGDEFWYNVPKKPNHKYEYLCRIINTVKEALRQAS